MRKSLLMIVPLLVGVLLFSTCEQPTDPDTTSLDTIPPTVTITFLTEGSVSEVVSITCMSSDNEGVEKVELWVDGVSTGITDETEPYSLDWNTTTYEVGSHIIIVRSYDTSGNTTDSDPITLSVDNSESYPTPVELYPVTYQDGSFNISWSQNNDDDFSSYTLYESTSEDMSDETLIFETEERTDTTYVVTGISEDETRYYQVVTKDVFGLETESEIEMGATTRPLPTEFPLHEDAGWVYERYYYADSSDYIEDIPDTVYNDTLFILTDIDEDGYSGYSWDLSDYYSVVKNYDNKFINVGTHYNYSDTTYYHSLPYIWASYDELYDTTEYVNNYGGFPSSRTEVVDILFGTPYQTYKQRFDESFMDSYVSIEGFSKWTIADENSSYYSRVIMIEKLDDTELQNALNIAREQVSRLPNNASNNFINIRPFISPAFGLNH